MSVANELTIWGYSLPPTDFHSSWLLRQAREAPLHKLVIINPQAASEKTGKVKATFIRRFKNAFRGRIKEIDISVFRTFGDYVEGNEVPYE